MQLATHPLFFKLWLHSREYETQALRNLFARQLIVPKEDGGIKGQYEMATQLEKKKKKSCINIFILHFGLDWFGLGNFLLLWEQWYS